MSLATLIEMFGPTAKPVEHYKAESRGSICELCPKNKSALWWEKMLKDPIAATIRRWLEFKNQMNLRVSMEDELQMCSVCGCCARLKIHIPIEHIAAHTKDLSKYPPSCWIPQELSP
jgi:hypothetical protein